MLYAQWGCSLLIPSVEEEKLEYHYAMHGLGPAFWNSICYLHVYVELDISHQLSAMVKYTVFSCVVTVNPTCCHITHG